MSRYTIGIIGGTGNMGRWFQKFFSGAGHDVLIAGRATALTFDDLAKKSHVVILSVPMAAALNICGQVGPVMRPDQLLMDVCSLKEKILQRMLENTSAQVIGTHPLFGPFTGSIKSQNIIMCPGRGTERLDWLEEEFRAKGAVISRMDPVVHDRHMAVVQGLTHLLTICMGRTLQKMNMPPAEAVLYSTPIFKINLGLIGRLFAQDLDLYADLIGENPHVKTALETFLSAMEEGKQGLVCGKNETGAILLREVRDFLGSFCQEGLKESNRLMNTLY